MPVRLIPNQLVKLYDTETLNQKNKRVTQDYRTYCQVVREEQTTMFQVELLPDSDNLITNGDFTDDLSSWNIDVNTWQWASGRAQAVITSAYNPSIFQTVNTTSGRVYKVRFTVDFQNANSRLLVFLSQGTILTWQYDAADYGLNPFDVEIYFTADQATAQLVFTFTGASGDIMFLDEVSVERLSETSATLEDCNGNLIENISIFAQAGKYVTYSVDWFGKDEGCYRICLEGTEDTESNYLELGLALGTEGGAAIELEQGGYIKWYG